MPSPDLPIQPVILAGGGGTRLWPLSRGHYPKQFLSVAGAQDSLLQETLMRLGGAAENVAAPLIVCNEEHRFLVGEQARQAGCAPRAIMLEPEGRNTAPALTTAARWLVRAGEDPVLMMMPADHLVADVAAFREAAARAVALAGPGAVVTLGIVPTRAEPGYGYIELGEPLPGAADEPPAHALRAFREKPDAATAERYLADGGFRWNSGIFVMKASVWLELAETHCQDIARRAGAAADRARTDGDFVRLEPETFRDCPSDSIDYAVMEPLARAGGRAAVVELDAGWSDVGSWSGLWDVSARDGQGNVTRGDVCTLDTTDSLVFAEHRLVATLGCDDLVVVETADAVLVADKKRSQDVKAVVDWLAEQNREERLTHRRVYRPWGYYESIDAGDGFQVKHITVNPGAALSLQMHHHRAEHWVVVRGTAKVTKGEENFEVSENESTFIPLGTTHRLENPTKKSLDLIEIQSGRYLAEDDIVRFEDRYNRAP